MPRPRIALATAAPGPQVSPDRDMPLLTGALAEAGAEAEAVHWDDPGADWAGYDLVVIRSTWDYTWRTAEFLAWAERCAGLTTLANLPSVLRWNSDKRYLGTLAERGVPVVDTRYLPPGSPADLPDDHEYVIKPVHGAGARYAARYLPEQRSDALRHLRRMHDEGLTAMVQPYLHRIDSTGERALVFIGGHYLHAIRKQAVLSNGTPYDQRKVSHPGLRPWSPTDAELTAAQRALAAIPGSPGLLYARVDLVDDDEGQLRVMELELVEPNLFLTAHPASLPTVAAAFVTAAETASAAR